MFLRFHKTFEGFKVIFACETEQQSHKIQKFAVSDEQAVIGSNRIHNVDQSEPRAYKKPLTCVLTIVYNLEHGSYNLVKLQL